MPRDDGPGGRERRSLPVEAAGRKEAQEQQGLGTGEALAGKARAQQREGTHDTMLDVRELVVVVRQEAPNGSTVTIDPADHTELQATRPQSTGARKRKRRLRLKRPQVGCGRQKFQTKESWGQVEGLQNGVTINDGAKVKSTSSLCLKDGLWSCDWV